MSLFGLDRLLRPRSVAIVGASDREGSVGRALVDNVADAGFRGEVFYVNGRAPSVRGRATFADLDAIGRPVDLVAVASPPASVVEVVRAACRIRAGAAVILTAGLTRGPGSQCEAIACAARDAGLRVLGPNVFGVLSPHADLNASFASRSCLRGDLALVTQSGAVAAALIEWAGRRDLGFSGVVSLGDAIDVDVSDCLDHFALDRSTEAILLYVEQIADAKKFMSAARAAARAKPVVVVKGGRHAEGARAAATHTGALAGADEVYDAAFRRAGLLRVLDLDQLFVAAQVLGRRQRDHGDRLAILTNGGGLGVLAADRLIDEGGALAVLEASTLAELDKVLPGTWSRSNPVDIIGDAGPQRFSDALDILLAAREIDAVIVLQAATRLASQTATAKAVVEATGRAASRHVPAKPVLVSWLGGGGDTAALFDDAQIPRFETERDAVGGFLALTRRRKRQETLSATPARSEHVSRERRDRAERIVRAAIGDGRTWLDPLEICDLLGQFRIPTVPTVRAGAPDEAAAVARMLLATTDAVVLKIHSRAIQHKSDVDGVALDLASPDAVEAAAIDMLKRVRIVRPEARDAAFILQPMARRPAARELIAGLTQDPTFGPVVLVGRGGVGVEVYADRALGLPPLDDRLAAEMIDNTQVGRTLGGYRNVAAADRAAAEATLVALGELAEISGIVSVDLNPLVVDESGVLAVDARVAVGASAGRGLAIRPYPVDWERVLETRGGRRYPVRPIRAEDEDLVRSFLERIDDQDLRARFFAPVRRFDHGFLARLVQIDYGRAMAFVAEDSDGAAGVVRLHCDADFVTGEFAVLVRSDLKGSGLGWSLMTLMVDWANASSVKTIHGEVLASNAAMLDMCRDLGFRVMPGSDAGFRRVELELGVPAEVSQHLALCPC